MKKAYNAPEMRYEILETKDVLDASAIIQPPTDSPIASLNTEKENVYKAASLFFENWL